MNRIYKFFAGILAISVVITAFKAYLLRSIDIKNQITYDGLGRVLSEPPWWAPTTEKVWAGIGWHLFDIVWFFGGLALALWLYSLSER